MSLKRKRTQALTAAAMAALATLAAPAIACSPAAGRGVLVLAAASTIDALEAAVAEYEAESGVAVDVSFGPTSMVARQVGEGAPADLMLSASADWADYVEARAAVERRVTLVGNRLVVVVGRGAETHPGPIETILSAPAMKRIAIADPESVPAGIYARQALRRLGLWETLVPKLLPTIDVRAALTLVSEGETEGGIVYATDAASVNNVQVVAEIDPGLHASIEYPLLLFSGSDTDAARLFEFLASERGRAHFLSRGFTHPDR